MDNPVENLVKVVFNFRVTEAQNADAMFIQIFCAPLVVFDLYGIIVDTTINFDFELVFDAKIVEDVGAERMLPTEFQFRETTRA